MIDTKLIPPGKLNCGRPHTEDPNCDCLACHEGRFRAEEALRDEILEAFNGWRPEGKHPIAHLERIAAVFGVSTHLGPDGEPVKYHVSCDDCGGVWVAIPHHKSWNFRTVTRGHNPECLS